MTFEELQIGFWVQDPCKDFPVQVHAMDASDKERVWVYSKVGGISLYRVSVDHLKPIGFTFKTIGKEWTAIELIAVGLRYIHQIQAFCRGIGRPDPEFDFSEYIKNKTQAK